MVVMLCQCAAGTELAAGLHLPAQDVPLRPVERIREWVLLLSKIPAEGYFYMVHHILKRKIIGSMEVQPVTQ